MSRHERARAQIQRVVGGRYRLLDVLGVGGTGAVFVAQHIVTEERFALKLIEKSVVASDPTAVERFLRESRAASRIGHPGIVRVFDAQADDATEDLYMVMELLKGQDLAEAMDRGDLSLRGFVTVVAELLDILAVVHQRGFVHRDVKPSNVFLWVDESGVTHVKLLDFGIARQSDMNKAMTSMGTVLGTPWYMAPEQARGHAVDGRADLWSVGALMYHALVGVPPFDGENAHVVISEILKAVPPSLRRARTDLPAALGDVVDRALQRDLTLRWQGVGEMLAALQPTLPALRDVPLRSTRGGTPPSTQTLWSHEVGAHSSPNTVRRIGFAAAALALCGVLVGSFIWKRGTAAPLPSSPAHIASSPVPTSVEVPAPAFVETPAVVEGGVPLVAPSTGVGAAVTPAVASPVIARRISTRPRGGDTGRPVGRRTPTSNASARPAPSRDPHAPMDWGEP